MAKTPTPGVHNLARALIALDGKSGRELAILGYAWIDAALLLNLNERLWYHAGVEPDPSIFDRALKNSDARLQVSEALGIFSSRIRKQTDLVRKVRNDFAHSIEDLDCESPSIKNLIGMMDLSEDEVSGLYMTGEVVAESAAEIGMPDANFTYDARRFTADEVISLFAPGPPWRVMFFVPRTSGTDPDARLRRQIRMCVWAVLQGGLQAYVNRTEPTGLALLEGQTWRRPGTPDDAEVMGPDHGLYR